MPKTLTTEPKKTVTLTFDADRIERWLAIRTAGFALMSLDEGLGSVKQPWSDDAERLAGRLACARRDLGADLMDSAM